MPKPSKTPIINLYNRPSAVILSATKDPLGTKFPLGFFSANWRIRMTHFISHHEKN